MNKNIMFIIGAFIFSLAILFLSLERGTPSKVPIEEMSTRCIDNVTYIIFKESVGTHGYGFMSIKFDKNGNVEICN